MLDCPCRRPTANSKRTTILPTRCVLPRCRKWRRAGHAYPHCRMTRVLASLNRRMPSHAFKPRAYATPPPVVGLIRNRGPAAAASQHRDRHGDNVQTSDPGYRRPLIPDDGGEQDEESSVVPPQAQASRAGMPSLSGDESGNEHELATPSHPCSRPPARSGPTFSTTSVVGDGDVVAILTTRRIALPLWEVTPSEARMRMPSSRHEGSAAR